MAEYTGWAGPKECMDCGKPHANRYLGRRIATPTGRIPWYGCTNCENNRLKTKTVEDKPVEDKKPVETNPAPTRVDHFTSGHEDARYYQASLFDE